MTAAHEQRIALHLVSDATGETLHAVARAAVSQFEHARVIYHRWGSVRTRAQLHRVLEGIEADPGTVLTTIMDRKLRAEFDVACERLGVRVVHVLDPVLTMLQDTIGEPAKGRAGSQYVLDEEYYRRIDAMHYVIAHDDGQRASGLRDADVVLVGVSRTSKTPTCFYLANRGVKAANVPLVPNLPLTAELDDLRCPIIGLTIDPRTLIEIRRHRLHAIAPSAALDFIGAHDSGYVDAELVRDEVVWARRLCARHAWPVIDVSRRSIEETAAAVIDIQEAWAARALAGRNPV